MMEYNQFPAERRDHYAAGAALSAADIETMTRLMIELREVTLSRKTFAAATDFLRRFGIDADGTSLVRPEGSAN